MIKSFAKQGYLALIYLFFYFPIFVLIVYSFNDAQFSMQWHGFTTDWYQSLFADSYVWQSAIRSLFLAITAASIATLIGTFASINLFRYQFFAKNYLYGLIFMLILVPDIILGISLLILFNLAYIPLGFFSLLIAHITFCIPFVVLTLYSRFYNIDSNLVHAARDLGASEWQIYRKILLPLLAPAILAAFLLSFTLSLDDVVISYFVAGPSYEILPLKIFSMVRSGVNPEINALCSLLFIVTLILVIIAHYFLYKKP